MSPQHSILCSVWVGIPLVIGHGLPMGSAAEPVQPTEQPAMTVEQGLAIPSVLLSKGHAATCLVGVGDILPNPRLVDLQGQEVDPATRIGRKATVVVLWEGNRPMTRMLLADLGPDVLEPYQAKGVALIGVAIQQDAATTREQLDAAGLPLPALLDPDGAAFARIGTRWLPRIYVLDPDCRIAWFDIEYSRATRRELRQTLEALTATPQSSPTPRPNHAEPPPAAPHAG